MPVNKTLTLNDSARQAINAQLIEGEAFAPEDVVEAGLSHLRKQKKKLETLRQSLIEGEESGLIKKFDWDQHRKEMEAESLENG